MTIAFVVGAVVVLPRIAAHTPELLGLDPVHAELGQAVDLHGSSTRPTMHLVASSPVTVPKGRATTTLGHGQHLVVVRVQVRNESVMTWTSPRLVTTAHDAAGAALTRVGLRSSTSRPALPPVLRLRPGSVVDGYVAFAVPRPARLSDFALTLGPSAYETVRWSARR
jgi:hypothetical protein